MGEHVSDLNTENIVIVPDRLSLITENLIFDELNIDVYFNVSVMGISKFSKLIINDAGLENLECSNLSSKLLVLKAIQNVCNNFKCFSKNYTLGFVDEIYAKIEQIKSSGAKIEELSDPNASDGTKLKFEDISSIYNEYERLRAGLLDSGAIIDLFNSISSSSDYLKKCNVFFVGFDSMTHQGISIVKNVCKNAHSCFVCVVEPNGQQNERIYDRSFFSSILALKDDGIDLDIKYINEPLKNVDADFALNNIFSRDNQAQSHGYFQINKALGFMDEIDCCIKSINYNLKTKDITFKDIAICAPKEYHEALKSKLSMIGVDAFLDEKVPLLNFEPIKLILAYLNYELSSVGENYLKVILNDMCEQDENTKHNLVNLIAQYKSIDTILKYEQNIDEKLKDELKNFEFLKIEKDKKEISYFIENTKKIIEKYNLIKKIDDFCEKMQKLNNISLEKQYRQIAQKLQDILDEINTVLNNLPISLDEYIELLTKAFSECEIIGVPSGVNQIQVSDYKSFFNNVKYMYVLGLNEGMCPDVLMDNGLISDTEILSKSIVAKLEPTTKIINKRNRFKLLEVILCAAEKCYLYYHGFGADGKNALPNDFITELEYLFNLDEISTLSLTSFTEKIDVNKIMYNAVNIYNANLLANQNNKQAQNEYLKKVLVDNNKKFVYEPKLNVACDFNELFFGSKKANVSLIESYNKCPKIAFLDKGLKLKKQKGAQIEPNIFGSFIHEVGELFVKQNITNLGNISALEVKKNVVNIVNIIKQKPEFYSITLEDNKFLFDMLLNECIRFCSFLNYEQSKSKFKPKYTEKYFGSYDGFKPIEIEVDGEKYLVSGIVDRIDVCEDKFRIIDYKTGSTNNDNSSGKEQLFYGNKIQLFIYAKAIKDNLNKTLFGAFYLPISNKHQKKGELSYHLSGFFEDNLVDVFNCDLDLNIENKKSNILNIELKKPDRSGTVELKKKDNILSHNELEAYLDYALKIMAISIKNLKNGMVNPSPIKDACGGCMFSDICEKTGNEQIIRDKKYDIKTLNISEIVNVKKSD